MHIRQDIVTGPWSLSSRRRVRDLSYNWVSRDDRQYINSLNISQSVSASIHQYLV